MLNYRVPNYSTRHSQPQQFASRPGFELRISGIRPVTNVALPYHKVKTTQRVRPNEGCRIIRQTPVAYDIDRQIAHKAGIHKSGRQGTVENKVLYGDAYICGSSVWKFLHVPF